MILQKKIWKKGDVFEVNLWNVVVDIGSNFLAFQDVATFYNSWDWWKRHGPFIWSKKGYPYHYGKGANFEVKVGTSTILW